jgi:KDO2-lipid IV(A) lauroyltransferase
VHTPNAHVPSDDPVADTEHFNHFIEQQVKRVPEQYWWIHRRFKGLCAEDPDHYKKASRARATVL